MNHRLELAVADANKDVSAVSHSKRLMDCTFQSAEGGLDSQTCTGDTEKLVPLCHRFNSDAQEAVIEMRNFVDNNNATADALIEVRATV